MTAKQLITNHVLPVTLTETGSHVLDGMKASGLNHLPLLDGHKLIGIISEAEIHAMDDPELEIGTINLLKSYGLVNGNQHVYEVLKMFSIFNLSMLPVVDDDNLYLGAIIIPTVVHALTEITGINHPGGIVVLEMNENEYNLAEIVQIVESNNAKILSCFSAYTPDSKTLEVTIKLNSVEIGPVLQAFYRLNYQVKSSWSTEDSFHEGLQERFDALMNYLNI
jgi:acetoin utilization protein AcuB